MRRFYHHAGQAILSDRFSVWASLSKLLPNEGNEIHDDEDGEIQGDDDGDNSS